MVGNYAIQTSVHLDESTSLGLDIYSDLMQAGVIFIPELGVKAYEFSLVLIVVVSSPIHSDTTSLSISFLCAKDLDASDQINHFWKLEETPHDKVHTPAEYKAMDHFKATHSRDTDGRYVVSLPYREPPVTQGCYKDNAVKRFLFNEKNHTQKGSWDPSQIMSKNSFLWDMLKWFLQLTWSSLNG